MNVGQLLIRAMETAASDVAIEWSDGAAPYSELLELSKRFAVAIDETAAPGRPIAVVLPRSRDAITAGLAAWRTGRPYVPISHHEPPRRIADKIALMRAGGFVASPEVAHVVAPHVEAGWLDPAEMRTRPGDHLASWAPERTAAYGIFTSGSTGTPKLVWNSHRSLERLLEWYVAAYDVGPEDRCSWVSDVGFDVSLAEIWPALTRGGVVLPLPDGLLTQPSLLAAWLAKNGVTLAYLPTAVAEQALDVLSGMDLSLRVLLTAGERLTRFTPDGCSFRLVNHYGPSETTVLVTAGDVPTVSEARTTLPSLGYPLPETSLAIVDPDGVDRLADGAIGEIVVCGSMVGLGYEPSTVDPRARNSFVPDVWSDLGGTAYRTGDLGRLDAEGALEFCGRIDDQVQLLGVRLQLSEIEQALLAQPLIHRAVVLPRVDEHGRAQSLTAFVLPAEGAGLDVPTVRAHLQDRLPRHTVPAEIRLVSTIPLGPRGKVDRQALALSLREEPQRSKKGGFASVLEVKIAGHWSTILGMPVQHRDLDYFALGGSSLSVAQLWAELSERYGAHLEVSDLYSHRTVAEQAQLISAWFVGRPDRDALVDLAGEDRQNPSIVFVHGISGGVQYAVRVAARLPGRVWGVQSHGFGGDRPPLAEWEAIVEDYVGKILDTTAGPVCVVGYCGTSPIALEVAERVGEHRPVALVLADPPLEPTVPRTLEERYREELASVASRAGLPAPEPRPDESAEEEGVALLSSLKLLGLYPPTFSAQAFHRQMSVYPTMRALVDQYRPRTGGDIPCRIVFTEQHVLDDGGDLDSAPSSQWPSHFSDVSVTIWDCPHLQIFDDERMVEVIGDAARALLASADSAHPADADGVPGDARPPA